MHVGVGVVLELRGLAEVALDVLECRLEDEQLVAETIEVRPRDEHVVRTEPEPSGRPARLEVSLAVGSLAEAPRPARPARGSDLSPAPGTSGNASLI